VQHVLIDYLASRVPTSDGVQLTLFRSPPRGPRRLDRPSANPVVLIPGAGANRYTFGLGPERSLPAVLNAHGRDVWLAELRGSKSSRGVAPISLCLKLSEDLPAILAHVRAATGATEVDLVGHSLGGLLALLLSATDEHIGRVVTVSAPGTLRGFVPDHPLVHGLARGVEALAGRLGKIAIAPWAKVPGPIPHLVSFQKHFGYDALDMADRRRYLDHCVEDMPGGDLAQLARWVREGVISDRHGRSLEPLFANVRSQILALSSAHDKIIPTVMVEAGIAKLVAADVTHLRLGKAHGQRRDYAHADVFLAADAVADVLEPIARWLDAASDVRTTPRSGASAGRRR